MTTLYLDTETFCETPIRNGLHAYAEKVEIMLVQWAFDDGPVSVVEFPSAGLIQSLVDEADEIVIQNSAFDRTVLRHGLGVELPLERIVDTMVQALAHGLPGSLDKLCTILGVPVDQAKDKAGKQLIQLFCKPRPKNSAIRRATKKTHPIEWGRFVDYARADIPSMRAVHKRLPRWNYPGNARERALWVLDQKINDRGVAVDMDLAQKAVQAADLAQKGLAKRTVELTNGEVEAATKRDQIMKHVLSEYGIDLPDMQKATLERRAEDPDLPEPLRELLRVRLATATTSVSKYQALLKSTSSDGRLRGTLQFCGAARTGRWAGRLFQPQNIKRPDLDFEDIEIAIAAIKAGVVDLAFDNPMSAISDCIRGALVASPGKKLVSADLANIEGRFLAWMAGEEWKLDAFRKYDAGLGPDLYKVTAGNVLGKLPEDVTKDERQLSGKVPELACGFQGAVGAFQSMAKLYGIDMTDSRALEIVKGWRKANPNIVRFWYDVEDAAVRAATTPGRRVECGPLVFQRDGSWLRIRLPSGRYLCYPGVKVEDGKLSYMGVNQYSRRWERIYTYGGKIAENCTQAGARDVLADRMPHVEQAGYLLVLSCHDENLTEAPDNDNFSDKVLCEMMCDNSAWAGGLPLAAEGWEGKIYRK